jgi:Ca-activated chloride channel family protein
MESVFTYVLSRPVLPLLLLAFPLTVDAQQLERNEDSEFQISVDVELVQLPVSVLDRDGVPVIGLDQQHFEIYEDGVRQNISLFQHEDVPISIGLVIDNSGSMRNKRERVNSAALVFVRESNPEDETFIVNFDDEAYLEQDFTGSIGNLIDTLENVDTRGETALNDAIYISLEHVEANGRMDKQALLVISDGEDNASKFGFNRVMERLQEAEVIVYVIGLLELNDQRGGLFRRSPSSRAKRELRQIAESTGGQAFFPESLAEVEGLCRRVAHELRNHFTLGYNPTNRAFDGTWREVEVKVNAPRGFPRIEVQTKPGYFAPGREAVSENP